MPFVPEGTAAALDVAVRRLAGFRLGTHVVGGHYAGSPFDPVRCREAIVIQHTRPVQRQIPRLGVPSIDNDTVLHPGLCGERHQAGTPCQASTGNVDIVITGHLDQGGNRVTSVDP